MKLTFLGHATFLLEVNGKVLLIDPFIRGNKQAAHLSIDTLKPDYILITHGHEDHMKDAEELAKKNDSPLISNYEIISWFEKKGMKGHGLNFGGKIVFDFVTIKYVQAVHSSMLLGVYTAAIREVL